MYRIDIDRPNGIIEFIIDGLVREDEMQRFTQELKPIMLGFGGREFKVKADLRTYKPASQQVTDIVREVQAFGLRSGMKQVAEVVESHMSALQLNRVARESGMDKILRRFSSEAEARRWLIEGDDAESSHGG